MDFDWNTFAGSFAGSGFAALFEGMILIGILVAIAAYVYFSFAWMNVAKKVKHPRPWLAWIPFANISLWLQMGGFHWAWVFLVVIPVLGWLAILVLVIISHWRVYEKLKYPGWLSLAVLIDILISGVGTIAYAIIIGLVAWRNNGKPVTTKKKATKKTASKK